MPQMKLLGIEKTGPFFPEVGGRGGYILKVGKIVFGLGARAIFR